MCLDRSWNDRRWSVSFMLSGLFSGRVFIHSPSHEKRAVIGMPSPKLQKEKSLQIIKQKLLWSHNLYFIPWELLLMCLAWKILITNGREVNKKGACLRISFTSVLKTWALAPLQITAFLCEGTIYLILCCVITFSNKRQNLRALLSCWCIVCS